MKNTIPTINKENYFDAAEGLWWYLSRHHRGQESREYAILSLLDFKPSMNGISDDAFPFYRAFKANDIDIVVGYDTIKALL